MDIRNSLEGLRTLLGVNSTPPAATAGKEVDIVIEWQRIDDRQRNPEQRGQRGVA